MREIRLEPFDEADIEELTRIMERAFDADAWMHLGKKGGPPGYNTGEFLRRYGFDKRSTQLKITFSGDMVGAVILWIDKQTNRNFLGNIFIDPDFQERGVGGEVWKKIESMFPDTEVWRTETPIFSHRNHSFYVNKCGFHMIKIENARNWEEGSCILEKKMK